MLKLIEDNNRAGGDRYQHKSHNFPHYSSIKVQQDKWPSYLFLTSYKFKGFCSYTVPRAAVLFDHPLPKAEKRGGLIATCGSIRVINIVL